MDETLDACYQWPIDERDYKYEEVCGSDWDIPDEYYIPDNGEIQDQNKAGYPYGCVFFSDSQGINLMNYVEWSSVRSSGKEMCDYAQNIGLFNPKSGAAIQSWPKVGQKLWYLAGYTTLSSLDEVLHSIANNRPVQCGSKQFRWNSATKENGWTISTGGTLWHSIIFDWYSKTRGQVRIKQSYDKWDKGHQWMNFSDFDKLFPSKFSLLDNPDTIITYRKKLMDNITIDAAKTAFENNLWNGERPKDPITREECAAIVQRALDSLAK